MANKLKKVMKPILKQKCSEAYQVGYQKGVENGWNGKCRAYENQIEYLRTMLDEFRSKDMVKVDEIKLHHILIDNEGVPEVKIQIGDRYFVLRTDPVDVVEVVRCKDCMWFDTKDELPGVFLTERQCFCTDANGYVSENHYCSYGERRSDGS